MRTYEQEQEMIRQEISKFPEEFGLSAWPGRAFRIGRHSYVSGDIVYLYTDIRKADGSGWAEGFAKCTSGELRREIISLADSKQLARNGSKSIWG
jgi:hypothetical protein